MIVQDFSASSSDLAFKSRVKSDGFRRIVRARRRYRSDDPARGQGRRALAYLARRPPELQTARMLESYAAANGYDWAVA